MKNFFSPSLIPAAGQFDTSAIIRAMQKLKQSSFFAGILVFIVVLSLFAAILHHHDGTHSEHECPACRLIQTLSLTLLSAAAVLLIRPATEREFAFISETSFQSNRKTSKLKDRAPPADFPL